MATISYANYEAFFLDYYEDNLTPGQITELMIFLEQNPELKEKFEEFEMMILEKDNEIAFEDKESLKKNIFPELTLNITKDNCEEFFIASVEGELSKNQENELTIFLQKNPQFINQFNLYKHTKLIPQHINYPFIHKLKRSKFNKPKKIVYYYLAAASIALLLVFFKLINLQLSDEIENQEFKTMSYKKSDYKFSSKTKTENTFLLAEKTRDSLTSQISVIKKQKQIASNLFNPKKLSKKNSLNTRKDEFVFIKEKMQPLTDAKIASPELNKEIIPVTLPDNINAQPVCFKETPEYIEKNNVPTEASKKITLWDIAKALTKGLSKLTKKDIQLKTVENEKGEVTAFQFNAEDFKFSKYRK